LNPVTDEVTHFVVKHETFPPADRLVPVRLIAESTPHRIVLRCSKAELSEMPRFTDKEFIPPAGGAEDRLLMWPYAVPESAGILLEHERIPPGELAVHRGARVEASDGHVGQVDEFLVDPETCHITHLVMREGHLWGHKDVVIPIGAIDHFDEETVCLGLDKEQVEQLPTVPIHRGVLP